MRPKDHNQPVAWGQFIRLYAPLIFHWGRRAGLQPDDAADLVQDVLATLLKKLPDFQYDRGKSFRAWLRTVTMNHWRDRLKRRATRPLPRHDAGLAGEDLLDQMIEREYRQALTGRALRLMQAEFQPRIWKACWKHAVEGRPPAAAVAAELGMTAGGVYAATCRVLGRLRTAPDGRLD